MNKFLETTPVIRAIYWHTIGKFRHRKEQARWAAMSPAEVFDDIYRTNRWNDPDSRSGGGSNLQQTEAVREALPGLFRRYGIRSFLDIPCGDFHWMSHVDLSAVNYLGGDIVPDLIAGNTGKHGSDRIHFAVMNLMSDPLPPADLLLVRDCLVHLSFADIASALANIKRSSVRYLLTTTFVDVAENQDIVTGQWRMLNFKKAPFHFPEPLELIDEKCTESRESRGKHLGLWEVSSLP